MLRALFKAYAATPLSQAINASSWVFAVTEMFHLMMLALAGGVVVVGCVGLSGLGFGFPDRASAWRGLRHVGAWALAGLLVSGVLLVGDNPLKYYFHPAFRVKMGLLGASLTLWAALDWSVRRERSRPGVPTAAAACLLGLLWLATAVVGRVIGLL